MPNEDSQRANPGPVTTNLRRSRRGRMVGVVLFVAALLTFFSVGVASAEDDSGESSYRGSTVVDDVAIAGVVVIVEDESGTEVGRATSDDEGAWRVPVPEPGTYVLRFDPDTIPDEYEAQSEELSLPVNPQQARFAPLRLVNAGEGGADAAGPAQDSNLRRFLQLTVDGIKFGLVIAMCAVGLSLIFGTTGLTNFAHGELVTFGALVGWMFNVRFGLNLVFAGVFAVGIGFVVGLGLERGIFSPLRRRGTSLIALIVVTIGMSLFVRYVFLYVFGGRTRAYADYTAQRGWNIGPVVLTPAALSSIVISIVVLGLVGFLLQRTRIGKAIRAVADNRDLASASGIDVGRVIVLVWGFGAALAALGGVLFGVQEQVGWEMGFQLLLYIFAGVTLGGLGTAYGALLGGVLVGIFTQLSTMVVAPELKKVGALVLLVGTPLLRPQGILGQRERIG